MRALYALIAVAILLGVVYVGAGPGGLSDGTQGPPVSGR